MAKQTLSHRPDLKVRSRSRLRGPASSPGSLQTRWKAEVQQVVAAKVLRLMRIAPQRLQALAAAASWR